MRSKFEQLFKNRMGLAIGVLFFAVFVLVFVIPKIYFSFDVGSRKTYWSTFLVSFGTIMFIFFRRKSPKEILPQPNTIEHPPAPRSYQKLLDEVKRCSEELKKHLISAYGCLIMGWIILSIGRWSDYSPYNQPIFAIPVFGLALLGATKSIEEENELDVSIANCTIEGIEMERRRPELRSSHFHDFAASYEGSGMWTFAFIRVSPAMMIIFSILNAGPLSLLVSRLSLPWWTASCFSGLVLGVSSLFLARMACRPYYWLLEKKKAITS